MKPSFRLIHVAALLLSLAAVTKASPIVWTLNNVALNDGGTASGTFTFNADAGTPCGFTSPCGTYSNVHIVTTDGSSRAGATYSFVCGLNVASCTGVTADSSEVLFLATNAANQSGDSALALFFTGISGLPPQGLTDLGGTIDVSTSSALVGTVQEGICNNAACTSPSSPARFSTAGTVSAVPEPASWLLLTAGFGLLATLRVRQR